MLGSSRYDSEAGTINRNRQLGRRLLGQVAKARILQPGWTNLETMPSHALAATFVARWKVPHSRRLLPRLANPTFSYSLQLTYRMPVCVAGNRPSDDWSRHGVLTLSNPAICLFVRVSLLDA